jgi:hypothetical protein
MFRLLLAIIRSQCQWWKLDTSNSFENATARNASYKIKWLTTILKVRILSNGTIIISRTNRKKNLKKTPTLAPLHSHEVTWNRTRGNEIRKQTLTTWHKVKVSLCLIKHDTMEVYAGGCIDPSILGLVTSCRWSDSRPGRFTPGTH